ncbi:GAP1-N2 domain-containing protein [Paenibacillus sp. FJAT-27812]|uniref:GAP1-N2 domain-containing protein n=1 Tax=Paenibacillus sp. FJAT-27812 TaxID=1684143 RepID=UPI0006A78514|nr:hypothetical protein [Paenibacillus sp. FJAT-27812]
MRDSMPRRMIQQQMYARERRGIFRSTEGYDTIAKSSGLDPAFIKKTLHPFCVYDAPAELSVRGEKDASAYPETMHLLHLDNGDVLLGRSVYQAADFTGLRSAFFTHNYIIPESLANNPDCDYERFLQASFEGSYDIAGGMEIAELAELPVQAAAAVKPSHRSLLSLLNIDEKTFKQLLYAVMSAVSGKKKVYIALDVPIAQLPGKAKQLMAVLYASLPYAYRRQLGFITYAKEPQSRKAVHLTFVEQGSLRLGDRSIEKDYTFDIASGRMMNVDLDGTDQPYLDFAWDNLERPERAESFYSFAELMLAGMGPERQIAAASYHELCVMYQIEEGNESLYEAHKTAVLRGLLEYLQPAGSLDSKIRLNDLFLSRFDYEFDRVRQGIVPDVFIVDAFKDYYRIDGKYLESKIVTYFILTLNQANRMNAQETVASIYAAVESNPALSKAFFTKLMADSTLTGSLFISFLEKKLKAAAGAKSVLELVEHWGNVHPKLFGFEPFQTLARNQMTDKLERERYSLPAVSRVLAQLRGLAEKARNGSGLTASYDAEDLYQELELAAYRAMLTELDMDKLTHEQLGQADFLTYKDKLQRWNGQLQDPRQKSAALMLLVIYEWLKLPEPTAAIFGRLSPAEMDRVQLTGRRLLAGQLELADAPRHVLAFLRSSDMESVDYAGLLDYLQRNAPSKEMIYGFFQLSERHPDFMKSRGFVPAYRTAIVGYFEKYDRDAFKKRGNWKQHFDKAGPALTAVYKQAARELSSPLSKFFRRNRKATLITSVAALGIILLVAGLLQSIAGKSDSKLEGGVLPEVTPTVETGITKPDTIVYAEQNEASEGVEATTSLVFSFKDAAACAQFAPSSLKVESAGAEAVEYTDLKVTLTCSTVGEVSPTPTNSADAAVTESQTPSTSKPTETPVNEGSTAPDATTKSESTSTVTPSSQPDQGSDGAISLDDYPSRVEVNLGKQVDLPAKSIIRVGEAAYELIVLDVQAN